jgi:hypothetical protein
MKTQVDNILSRTDDPESDDLAVVVAVKGTGGGGGIPVIPVNTQGANATTTRVASSGVSVTLAFANATRVSVGVTNNSPAGNKLYVRLGSPASIGAGTESFVAIVEDGGFFRTEPGEYSGIVTGIWDAADPNGEALVTEVIP